jgi:NADPH:quinone reductase-like Zn-dependent oxidoreductase
VSDPATPAARVSPAIPATSTVWRQRRYGGPETLAAETVHVTPPRRGNVLLRMDAVSLNSGDIHLLRGEPRLLRPFAGWRGPRVRGRGMDVAGTVIAVGGTVDRLAVGDLVVGAWRETLAEVVEVPAARLSRVPVGVEPAVAAALPIAGNTAVTVLDACRVRSGSRVLVVGAGGGVGTLTVQLAADRGAEVWATCGARAEELLRSLGARRTFDYRRVPLSDLLADAAAAHGFDAIVDIAGEPPLPLLSGLLAPAGTVALVGGEGDGVLGPIPRMLRAVAARGRYRPIAAVTKTAVTDGLLELAASGRLTPPIERVYRLAEAAAALAHVDAGHTVGKVVVVP